MELADHLSIAVLVTVPILTDEFVHSYWNADASHCGADNAA
jgi:hypothetical protein